MQSNRYGKCSRCCTSNNLSGAYHDTFRCVDKPGLLLKSLGDDLTPGQSPYARDDAEWHGKDYQDLLSVVREVKPHVLIGTSTCPKAFTEEIVKEMAKHVERPMIFPLSNPTKLHEADPKDLNEWTEGKALIATGSPFPPVEYNGKEYEVGELSYSAISSSGGFREAS